jgi:phosphatidylinositol dimannoside acyltransferase
MLAGIRGRAVDLGFAAGWAALRSVPEPLSARAFRAGADYAAVRNGKGAQQLRRNLRRVLGPNASELRLDRLVGDALRSYSRYWLETFRLPEMDHADVLAHTTMVGAEHIDAALARGRGFVGALPHLGNWDVAALWLVAHGHRFTTVAERLQPQSLFDRFVAYREDLGMEVLALTGGQRPPTEVLAERLRGNAAVCLVADRDLSRTGVEVSFFGEPARMPAGPALLAATTGAALLPVGLWFTEDGWGQRVHPPLHLPPEGRLRDRVAAGTQALADVFAREIAEHPADWHMLQKLWVADLGPPHSGPAGRPHRRVAIR